MNYKHMLINGKQVMEMITSRSLFQKIDNWSEFLADYFNISLNRHLEVRFRNGMKLRLRPGTTDKWSVHEIVLRDDYQLPALPKKAVVFDIGACEGAFSAHVASLFDQVKVYALEPNEMNFALLKENIAQNKLQKKVKVLKAALDTRLGKVRLYLSPDRRTHSLSERTHAPSVVVKALSLSYLFKKYKLTHCDFMKVDIEGAEYDILYKLPNSLFKKIRQISMEYHNHDEYKRNGTFLATYLKTKGYEVEYKDTIDRTVGHLYAIRRVA